MEVRKLGLKERFRLRRYVRRITFTVFRLPVLSLELRIEMEKRKIKLTFSFLNCLGLLSSVVISLGYVGMRDT